jgi:hypothetical protein
VKDVCEPFKYSKMHYGTSSKAEIINNPFGVNMETCLSTLIREFMTQNMGDEERLQVEEWVDHSDSSSDDDMYYDGPSGLSTWPDKLQKMQMDQCSEMFEKRSKYAQKCHFAKYRVWAKDSF